MKPNGLHERIIVALDYDDRGKALHLLDKIEMVRFVKIGPRLLAATDWSILREAADRGKEIFLDLKLHDIPSTVAGTIANLSRFPIFSLSVHAASGSATLKAAVQKSRSLSRPIHIWAVTLLTSFRDETAADELMLAGSPSEYVQHLALLARYCGADGVISPADQVARIKETCGQDFIVVVPGVRPAGWEPHDQQRSSTPARAIEAGADFLVIGRAITASSDPAASFFQIVEEINDALGKTG
ncbi:MAG: orotidine-5'-phosphate decarboxylase [Armatimonadetes bacterium]|nr:orotidine-5'-phosphate decarboxylase [Armatimonadota bacterium]MDW8120972.1 orotidine-5'-phosphate decarboxylase [Armatimonadota bacterium]